MAAAGPSSLPQYRARQLGYMLYAYRSHFPLVWVACTGAWGFGQVVHEGG